MLNATSSAGDVRWPGAQQAANAAYGGPERRRSTEPLAELLPQVLDEIDDGLLLLGPARQVLHLNLAARLALAGAHPLQQIGAQLLPRRSQDHAPWNEAVHGALRQGRRRLLSLGDERGPRAEVTVMPLPGLTAAPHAAGVLVALGRQQLGGALSLQGFARACRLSPGEESVLRALSDGLTPLEIAGQHGVALATVRTQIGSLRAKTGARSIRDLLQRVALLPPMRSVLRASLVPAP